MIPWWLTAASGAIVTLIIGFMVHTIDVDRIEAKQEMAIQTQVNYDIAQCDKNKQITTNTEQQYEQIIAKRDADINELSKRPSKCVSISRPASKRNAADKPIEPNIGNAIDSGRFYDFAGSCETDRGKVIVLQQFIREERHGT